VVVGFGFKGWCDIFKIFGFGFEEVANLMAKEFLYLRSSCFTWRVEMNK